MRLTCLLLAFTMLIGCATPVANSGISDLTNLGVQQFEDEFDVFRVPSSGAIADATFITLSKGSPSAMSEQLAQVLASAEAEEVKIVIGGPNSSKTRVVIDGALTLLEGQKLTHLQLMFVGADDDAEAVGPAVSSAGGRFYSASQQQ